LKSPSRRWSGEGNADDATGYIGNSSLRQGRGYHDGKVQEVIRMTKLIINIDRDAHDDDKFTVIYGDEVEATFWSRDRLLEYLSVRIANIADMK
jgi:hypothetical protein